jgi:hypothetical protein
VRLPLDALLLFFAHLRCGHVPHLQQLLHRQNSPRNVWLVRVGHRLVAPVQPQRRERPLLLLPSEITERWRVILNCMIFVASDSARGEPDNGTPMVVKRAGGVLRVT